MLGSGHKQGLTCRQIHGLLKEMGHDIGLKTVKNTVKEKRGKAKEAFIRQQHEPGERMEFDFGQVHLVLGGKRVKLHLAVFTLCNSGWRWAQLYETEGLDVFLESHAEMFADLVCLSIRIVQLMIT